MRCSFSRASWWLAISWDFSTSLYWIQNNERPFWEHLLPSGSFFLKGQIDKHKISVSHVQTGSWGEQVFFLHFTFSCSTMGPQLVGTLALQKYIYKWKANKDVSMCFCQFFWLERKFNLGANLCIKNPCMIGFWSLAAYLGSGGPKKSLHFLLHLFHISETANENRKQSVTEQAFPLSKHLHTTVLFLFFSPKGNLQKGMVSVKQNNDEELALWTAAVLFLPAIFYGSRFPTCLVLKRISFCLGIPRVTKRQWHHWEPLSFHFHGLCMGGHSPTLIAKDCEGGAVRGRGEEEKFPGKH